MELLRLGQWRDACEAGCVRGGCDACETAQRSACEGACAGERGARAAEGMACPPGEVTLNTAAVVVSRPPNVTKPSLLLVPCYCCRLTGGG